MVPIISGVLSGDHGGTGAGPVLLTARLTPAPLPDNGLNPGSDEVRVKPSFRGANYDGNSQIIIFFCSAAEGKDGPRFWQSALQKGPLLSNSPFYARLPQKARDQTPSQTPSDLSPPVGGRCTLKYGNLVRLILEYCTKAKDLVFCEDETPNQRGCARRNTK